MLAADVTMLVHGARQAGGRQVPVEYDLLRGRYLVRPCGKRAARPRCGPRRGGEAVLPCRSGGLMTVATGGRADRNP